MANFNFPKSTPAYIMNFFNYSFTGDGTYRLYDGSGNSFFGLIFLKNKDGIDVINSGNDAPRGGRSGEWVEVVFNSHFFEKYSEIIASIKAQKAAIELRIENIRLEKEAIGNQRELLISVFKEEPLFLKKIIDRIETKSSKNWRSWVCMKVCAKIIPSQKFELFSLSAAEIRDIAYSI